MTQDLMYLVFMHLSDPMRYTILHPVSRSVRAGANHGYEVVTSYLR